MQWALVPFPLVLALVGADSFVNNIKMNPAIGDSSLEQKNFAGKFKQKKKKKKQRTVPKSMWFWVCLSEKKLFFPL